MMICSRSLPHRQYNHLNLGYRRRRRRYDSADERMMEVVHDNDEMVRTKMMGMSSAARKDEMSACAHSDGWESCAHADDGDLNMAEDDHNMALSGDE